MFVDSFGRTAGDGEVNAGSGFAGTIAGDVDGVSLVQTSARIKLTNSMKHSKKLIRKNCIVLSVALCGEAVKK